MTSTKDPVRKTELFFSMYDIDRNGLIDENEMRCVVEVCFRILIGIYILT
jgi:Ca2+-binding EF-hand superfamily protein